MIRIASVGRGGEEKGKGSRLPGSGFHLSLHGDGGSAAASPSARLRGGGEAGGEVPVVVAGGEGSGHCHGHFLDRDVREAVSYLIQLSSRLGTSKRCFSFFEGWHQYMGFQDSPNKP